MWINWTNDFQTCVATVSGRVSHLSVNDICIEGNLRSTNNKKLAAREQKESLRPVNKKEPAANEQQRACGQRAKKNCDQLANKKNLRPETGTPTNQKNLRPETGTPQRQQKSKQSRETALHANEEICGAEIRRRINLLRSS